MVVFLRCIDFPDKAGALRRVDDEAHGRAQRYAVPASDLRLVPTAPFAYWVSNRVREIFDPSKAFERDGRIVRQGLATSDDFRFVRIWVEAPADDGWVPIVKGGRRSTFYRDTATSINWKEAGAEVKAFAETTAGTSHWSRNIRNVDLYFVPGVSWPLRGVVFSAHAVPAGSVFSIAGKMAFVPDEQRMATLAIMNSSAFDRLMGLFAGKTGGVQYEAGLIRRTPMPDVGGTANEELSKLAFHAWSMKRRIDMSSEASHAFVLPALLRGEGCDVEARRDAWGLQLSRIRDEVDQVEARLDELCYELYDISAEDRASIALDVGGAAADGDTDDDSEADDGQDTLSVDAAALAASLVSWCVGVAVGRFDVRLAIGEQAWPEQPDPFDPLPVCSSGMLAGQDGLPLQVPPAEYPVEVAPELVDDPGHRLDIAARVRSVFEVVFGDDADGWWTDVGEALSAKGREVGAWLSKGFFDHHLRTYSKSRRKAPIYWPLGTGSGSYIVWVYGHRTTGDSLFRLLTDVVSPKLVLERRRLSELVQEAGPNPSATQRKAIDGQEKLVEELREFVDGLRAVAPLWHPDLNDGVVIVLAPLWRLFTHHKAWSKELRTRWNSLVAGEHDWAHLAMHLWPERVVPKCAEDRSLAIAHGLEDVFWIQDEDNPEKWHPRRNPTASVEQLIADRTEPATKAALEDALR